MSDVFTVTPELIIPSWDALWARNPETGELRLFSLKKLRGDVYNFRIIG